MNTLVPLEYYTVLYYYILLAVVIVMFLNSRRVSIDNKINIRNKEFTGKVLLGFVIAYLGTRPISGRYFLDMRTYANGFLRYASGEPVRDGKDLYFEYFMKACSSIMSVEMFFLLCAFLYVVPLYIFCKRAFKEYWFYGFFILLASMSFWAYGTNGIRNGIASSLLLMGFTNKKLYWKIAIFAISAMFHKSMIIPIAAYLIAVNYRDFRVYLFFWFLATPLSLVLGGFWEAFFMNIGFGAEDRLQGYFGEDELDAAEEIIGGYRWDFVLYSATGVFAGWFFLVRKKFEDEFYTILYSTYLIANAFWILVIRAEFSNRFAYLSWFMLGAVILYPLLVNLFYRKQHQVVANIIAVYFLFTLMLNVILAGK